jgi:hypothetical protein
VSYRLIPPAKNTCLWNVRGEKILEPVDIVFCHPSFFALPIQAMDCDDAMIR